MKIFRILFLGIFMCTVLLLFFPSNFLHTDTGMQDKKQTKENSQTSPVVNKSVNAPPTPTLDLYSRSEDIPYDELFITEERQAYETGDLTLIIPKLSLKEKVQNGTSKEALAKGPGLYDYAQLPGEGDRNVSIAAHRNKSRNGVISEWFFYYIDTLCEGDYIYLTDSQYIYRYLYDQTTIVEETDWSPIYSQKVSCVTLTSCEPIGVADHRIIVRAILDEITPYHKEYVYVANSDSST